MKKRANRIRIYLGIKFSFLSPYLLTEKELEKALLFRTRVNLSALGFDLSEMTDDEIKDSIINFSLSMSQLGVTSEMFAEELLKTFTSK
jgi:hypothetical protein